MKKHLLTILMEKIINKNSSKGYPKHFVPAIKEWKDSVYSYNEKYLKYISVNNKRADNFIKSHFFLSNLKRTARSKRMRNLIQKNSSKRIFVSRPHIKHNNDKTIINLYTYNRQKEFIVRKLFFFRKKQNLLKLWLKSKLLKKIKIFKKTNVLFRKKLKKMTKRYMKNKTFFKKRVLKKNFFKKRFIKTKLLPFNGIKLRNELNFLTFKARDIFKRYTLYKSTFIYIFLCKVLTLFGINTLIPIFKYKKRKNDFYKLINSKYYTLIFFRNKLLLLKLKEENIRLFNMLSCSYKSNYEKINLINKLLFNFIEHNFIQKGLISKHNLHEMYFLFRKKHKQIFYANFFKKDIILNYLNMLWLNNLKFSQLIYNLKLVINRIYNKKIEFNITNLKTPFLNSDIYSDIIANKAKKKKLPASKVLGVSTRLYNKPEGIMYHIKEKIKLERYIFKAFSLNNLFNHNDKLNNSIIKGYPNYYINRTNIEDNSVNKRLNKVNDVLNSLMFKWVSGIKLQLAGRLTKRNTAAKSILRIKYKGSLRNKQYYIENEKLKITSSFLLRNTVKSNSQYTFLKSRRRIGAFGVKTWISSY